MRHDLKSIGHGLGGCIGINDIPEGALLNLSCFRIIKYSLNQSRISQELVYLFPVLSAKNSAVNRGSGYRLNGAGAERREHLYTIVALPGLQRNKSI